ADVAGVLRAPRAHARGRAEDHRAGEEGRGLRGRARAAAPGDRVGRGGGCRARVHGERGRPRRPPGPGTAAWWRPPPPAVRWPLRRLADRHRGPEPNASETE